MRTLLTFTFAILLTLCASISSAQPSVRGVGALGLQTMSATDSFDAVVGKTSLQQFGGGVQVVNLWRSLFVEATVERLKADGERVFVSDGTVFPLGIPLTVRLVPVDIVGGWRFRKVGRVVPYGGAGLTSVSYSEKSSFAESDDVSERGTGFIVLGGVEVPVWRWVGVRGEVRFRQVPDVLGSGGASAVFDETSLGGVSYGVKLTIGR